MPHFHLSGMQGVILALFIVAFLGGTKMLAASFPENDFARAWLKLL